MYISPTHTDTDFESILDSIPGKQAIIEDLAEFGCGYTTCTTASSVAAKIATIPNFIPFVKGYIGVYFTESIVTQNTTLNISNTGAKPIYYRGAPIPAGLIKTKTVALLQYDGTNYNVIKYEQVIRYLGDYVDLGLPSGRLWARRNLDPRQSDGFALSEYQYDCAFFSWGNTDPHYPINDSRLDYAFNSTNYASTIGSTIASDVSISDTIYDAAKATLGSSWMIPTHADATELFDYCVPIDANGDEIPSTTVNKLITINNVVGLRLKSTINGNTLFMAATGRGYTSNDTPTWANKTAMATLWLSNTRVNVSTDAYIINCQPTRLQAAGVANKFIGFPIRPVQ